MEEEVLKVIKSLKRSVAPGPNRFTASYYKHYASILTPRLTTMFNNILKGDHFPNERTLANMSLLPKPLKDHSLPQNYRLILVIKNDLKIFSRALADRLADQKGFIPNRLITDNISLALNVLQDANLHKKQVLLLSLDINKAFDSVLWPYLLSVLQQMGFRDKFLSGVQALYHQPKTRIRLPGCNSDFITLGRGTLQGCPLSPLLFVLALEPLAIAIR